MPSWDDGEGGCHWDGYHREGERPGCPICDPRAGFPAVERAKIGRMKTRSQVMAEKKAKTPAAERTLPIPEVAQPPEAKRPRGAADVHCDACGEDSPETECSRRADGTVECASCGAPISKEGLAAIGDPKDASKSPIPPPKDGFVDPRIYCDQCGAEWPRLGGAPMPNCGHKEGFVYDPQKAKRWKPPAGHPRAAESAGGIAATEPAAMSVPLAPTTFSQISKLAVVEGKGGGGGGGAPRVSVTDVVGDDLGAKMPRMFARFQIEWGKVTFGGKHFKAYGPFTANIDVPTPGGGAPEDAVLDPIVDKALGQLEKMATKAFRAQQKWFTARLKELDEEE